METLDPVKVDDEADGAGSGVMVEVEVERPKVLAKGARWVSLSSADSQIEPWHLVESFHTLCELPRHCWKFKLIGMGFGRLAREVRSREALQHSGGSGCVSRKDG
jgi:hypothetical protein